MAEEEANVAQARSDRYYRLASLGAGLLAFGIILALAGMLLLPNGYPRLVVDLIDLMQLVGFIVAIVFYIAYRRARPE